MKEKKKLIMAHRNKLKAENLILYSENQELKRRMRRIENEPYFDTYSFLKKMARTVEKACNEELVEPGTLKLSVFPIFDHLSCHGFRFNVNGDSLGKNNSSEIEIQKKGCVLSDEEKGKLDEQFNKFFTRKPAEPSTIKAVNYRKDV